MILVKTNKGKSIIRERNDDNINRDFEQEEGQPGMHAHMMIEHMTHIETILRKYRIQI
jgi:hypothetical protein